jgi:hypothetical protein
MNPPVGPDPSIAPGGQLVPAGEGYGCPFPQSGIPEGPVPRPRRARQAVQILILFEPIPRLGRFGFRLSPYPPATTPLTGGPRPTGQRV